MICENCGHPIKESRAVITMVNEQSHFFCADCAKLFGTCVMCAHSIGCAFTQDPDPTPPFVVVSRQVRQGNATFIEQKQIPNGDRIKKFCLDGKCKCAIDDPERPLCCRNGGYMTCTNYCEKEKHNFVQNFPMQEASEN
jgi:hypothetical protein